MKQVLQAQPLAFLHENVPSFPIGELERILGRDYIVESVQLDPTDCGFPVQRKRQYALAVHRSCMKFSGLSRFVSDSCDLLGRLNLVLDDFLLDSCPMSKADIQLSLAKTQKNWVRYYLKKFSNSCVIDLTQNPEKRPRKGITKMPTLTTSCSKMLHVQSGRFFVGMELALLHGMPVTDSTAKQLRVNTFNVNVDTVSNVALCARVGNSMHCASVGMVLAAVLTCLRPHEK
ncbi:unnamed protein product [Durusdinium trenchii]|uniref:Uncharacterized protein n=1 Tax=Durusdinium trenchii TaxID=1381693 RepID=A0ABP0HD35_9DINO